MKNLSEVKKELVESGLMYEADANKTTERNLLVTGEWTRDNKIENLKTRQGISGNGIIPKYVDDKFELPDLLDSDDTDEVEDKFIRDLKAKYEGYKVYVRID